MNRLYLIAGVRFFVAAAAMFIAGTPTIGAVFAALGATSIALAMIQTPTNK